MNDYDADEMQWRMELGWDAFAYVCVLQEHWRLWESNWRNDTQSMRRLPYNPSGY